MIQSFLILSLAFIFLQLIPNVSPFSIDRRNRLNFHQVLQRVGKTVLRPGGSEATDTLHEWAGLNQDSLVLELASGLGTGGMALATRYQCHVTMTDRDEERLEQAKALAAERGLQDLVETKVLDMNHLDQGLHGDHFDAIIVEASLTHFADAQKLKVIQELSKHTNELLLHEVILLSDTHAQEIEQQVGEALAIGFHPMSLEGYDKMLDKCGFQVVEREQGSLRLLNTKSLFRDEGIRGVARIAWNLATQKDLRDRVVETKGVIDSHRDRLGYMVLRADKKKIK